MNPIEKTRPPVLIDADVLFAGAAGPTEYGASLVILRMAEITLIEAITCQQVINEVERNLLEKMPAVLPVLRLLVSRCLRVVPTPNEAEIDPYHGLAHTKDLPILVTAIREQCPMLVTFNQRHYQPGHPKVEVMLPGDFVRRVRYLLTGLLNESNLGRYSSNT